MKRYAVSLRLMLCLCAAASLAAAEKNIEVPDLETRISGAGNPVPESALPPQRAPLLPRLPEPAKPEPAPVEAPPVAAIEAPPAVVETEAQPSGLTGSVRFGGGYPTTLFGVASLSRPEDRLPALAVNLYYQNRDGYGPEESGTGYSAREAGLEVSVRSGTDETGWAAYLEAAERADGFQGEGTANALVRRRGEWSFGYRRAPDSGSRPGFSLSAGGALFSAFAEMPSSLPEPFPDEYGYRLEPGAGLSLAFGDLSLSLTGAYAYETVESVGELHAGSLTFDAGFSRGPWELGAAVAMAADSEDGILVPFSVHLAWTGERLDAKASGGLLVERLSAYELFEDDPFARPHGGSVYAADWGGDLRLVAFPNEPLRLAGSVAFRKSAFGRGTLLATGSVGADGLADIVREERESLVVALELSWEEGPFRARARWSSELLDRAYAESLHELESEVGWRPDALSGRVELFASGAVGLAETTVPEIGAGMSVRVADSISATLEANDIVLLATRGRREVNERYDGAAGSIVLSAKIEL